MITVTITANTRQELEDQLFILLGEPGDPATVRTAEGKPVATIQPMPGTNGPETAPPKNKGGRPRKVDLAALAPVVPSGAEGEAGQETEADAVDSADAKTTAIELLRKVFGRAPKGSGYIKALQQKYAVTKFVDVPDARAAELLADARKADAATVN